MIINNNQVRNWQTLKNDTYSLMYVRIAIIAVAGVDSTNIISSVLEMFWCLIEASFVITMQRFWDVL